MPNRFDFVDLSQAQVTPEGWIRDRPILARTGILEYRRADGTIRYEYRPPEEVFHEDALKSLRGVPVTDGHQGIKTAADPHGIIGSVLTEGFRQGDNVVAELVIYNPKAMGSKRELSLGYSVELDETPGVINGQRYDAIQRKIRVNHAGVVHRGRAGNARLRLDGADAVSGQIEEDQMPAENVKLVTVKLDGLDYHAAPEVSRALDKAQAALAEANKRADALEAERDAAKAKLSEAEKQVEKVRADAVAQVRARLELEATAKTHGVEVKADMTDRAIREAVIAKVRGGDMKFDGKSDDYVQAAYDLAVAEKSAAATAAASQRAAAAGAPPTAPRADAATTTPATGAPVPAAVSARQRMLASIRH